MGPKSFGAGSWMDVSGLPVSLCLVPAPILCLSPTLILTDFPRKPIRVWHLSRITACVCYGSTVSHKTRISITSPGHPPFFSPHLLLSLFLSLASRDTGSCGAGWLQDTSCIGWVSRSCVVLTATAQRVEPSSCPGEFNIPGCLRRRPGSGFALHHLGTS